MNDLEKAEKLEVLANIFLIDLQMSSKSNLVIGNNGEYRKLILKETIGEIKTIVDDFLNNLE